MSPSTRRNQPAVLRRFVLALVAWGLTSSAAWAVDYLSAEEARQLAFPDAQAFEKVELSLSKEQRKTVEKYAGARMRFEKQPVWRVVKNDATAGWFIVDEVLGKHEYITYAAALDASGKVLRVEILSYRETHGGEVTNPRWLDQFDDKAYGDSLRLGNEVAAISGATLSCKHLTEGMRRILALHHEILAPLDGKPPG
jgi:Na+-transporting NADH:ubiquinone oxidoreductase subunit NqrC